MNNLKGSVLSLLAAFVVASGASQVVAQQPPPGLAGSMPLPSPATVPAFANAPFGSGPPQGPFMPPQAMYNAPPMPGYGQAAFGPPDYGPGISTQPNWGVAPASYQPPQPFPSTEGMGIPPNYEMGGEYFDGGTPYREPGLAERVTARMAECLLPYAEGGQCAPRWYDITLDAMYLTRDSAGRNTDFASDGVNGDILLSTNDLNFNETLGFRFTAAHQIFAGATAEFTYFGLFDWDSSAVNRPPQFVDDIFSVYSDFGNINTPLGFDETDRSRLQTLRYSSTTDNFELNIRKRLTAPNCRLQYSWLMGIRYFYLVEDFQYYTLGGDFDAAAPGLQSRGSSLTDVRTKNSLTGFQVGGDGWLNLTPGVNIGGDIKAGVFGNYANQATSILATTTAPAASTTYNEKVHGNDISLIADANLYFMWRLNPHWTVRVGYNFLFLEGVALGSENFNTTAPNIFTGAGGAPAQIRVPTINDNGNIFYHGGFGGIEWTW